LLGWLLAPDLNEFKDLDLAGKALKGLKYFYKLNDLPPLDRGVSWSLKKID
jgi:hypothetical protein